MTDTKKFKEKLKEKKVTGQSIARELGISYRTLYGKMNNETRFTIQEIGTISEMLKINSYKEIKELFLCA